MYGDASVEEWSARYEAVRQRALLVRHPAQSGWELALLARRGVAAWLRAWAGADQPPSSCRAALLPSDSRPMTDVVLSTSLGEQITSVLVSMILPQRSLNLEPVS